MSTHLLTPRQVAERLGIHHKTAAIWMRRGHLPAVNLAPAPAVRACWRVDEAELEKWVKSRPAA